jgi:ParB-like chromosome segregation protein Spo0J
VKEFEIPIEKIYVPSKHRSDLDPEKIEARAENILSEGELRSPISIRRDGDRYVLVKGLHRLEALRALGETTATCIIVQARQH